MGQIHTQMTVAGVASSWGTRVSQRQVSSVEQLEYQYSSQTTGDILDISTEAERHLASTTEPELGPQTHTLETGEAVASPKRIVADHWCLDAWFLGIENTTNSNTLISFYNATIKRGDQALDTKIAGILDKSGIELDRDESFELSVDSQGGITVEGLDDTEKSAALEEALNADATLGVELLRQHAYRAIRDQEMEYWDAWSAGADPSLLPNIRHSPLGEADSTVSRIVLNDLLEKGAGASIDDLSLEGGELITENARLSSLLENEANLVSLAKEVLGSEDQGEGTVTFAYKNGTVLDTENLDDQSLDDQARILGDHVALGRESDQSLGLVASDLSGFQMTLNQLGDQVGEFQSLGTGSLDQATQRLMKGWFNGDWGLRKYAAIREERKDEDLPHYFDGTRFQEFQKERMEFVSEAVVDDILRREQYEHGDTDEYAHEVEFTFNAHGGASYQVVSEEADAAIQVQLGDMTPEVSEGLKQYFQSEGVNTSEAMLVQFDEKGYLTCNLADGDPRNGKVQAAVDKLNLALERGEPMDALGATFDHLLEVKELLATLHDSDTNAYGFVVGG